MIRFEVEASGLTLAEITEQGTATAAAFFGDGRVFRLLSADIEKGNTMRHWSQNGANHGQLEYKATLVYGTDQ